MAEVTNKKEKLSFHVTQALPFENLIQTMYSDSSAFCNEAINPLMRMVFNDYYGSKIEVAQNKSIITSLYFAENNIKDEGKTNAIERVITSDSLRDIDNRIKMVNNTIGSKSYQNQFKLTQDGKDILEDIVPSGVRQSNGKINWGAITSEGILKNTFGMNNDVIYIQVVVDINKIIPLIYGSKDGDDTYQYMVTIGNPINPQTTYGCNIIVKQWQMFVMKLSSNATRKIAQQYGISGQNNLGIIC